MRGRMGYYVGSLVYIHVYVVGVGLLVDYKGTCGSFFYVYDSCDCGTGVVLLLS
jgi:hypothetical protein